MPTMKNREGSMMSHEKKNTDSIHGYAGHKGEPKHNESKEPKAEERREAKMSPKARQKAEDKEMY